MTAAQLLADQALVVAMACEHCPRHYGDICGLPAYAWCYESAVSQIVRGHCIVLEREWRDGPVEQVALLEMAEDYAEMAMEKGRWE